MAIWLSLPYLIFITWVMISTFQYNAKWEGVFWRTEIYYGTIYINFVPVIVAFLAVLIGSTRSLIISIVVIGLIVVAVGWDRYMLANRHFSLNRNGSLEISSKDARLRVDINCEYTKSYDYRGFRYYDSGGCGNSKVTVLSKSPTHGLPPKSTWVIDGTEIQDTMWPINGPNDSSSISRFAVDEHAYDHITRWRTGIPIRLMMKANQVEFRWGNITIPLYSEQLETLKRLQRDFEQLSGEA